MKNPRITPKERGLLKGAARRVFSRSELRRKVLDTCIIHNHQDESRPRVKRWGRCTSCKNPTPLYLMQIDHKDPIVPLNMSLDMMSWDDLINRIWCEDNNLDPLCKFCHNEKTSIERKERLKLKRGKKDERKGSKTNKKSTKTDRKRNST